jgi:hypothetical protein
LCGIVEFEKQFDGSFVESIVSTAPPQKKTLLPLLFFIGLSSSFATKTQKPTLLYRNEKHPSVLEQW